MGGCYVALDGSLAQVWCSYMRLYDTRGEKAEEAHFISRRMSLSPLWKGCNGDNQNTVSQLRQRLDLKYTVQSVDAAGRLQKMVVVQLTTW